MLTGQIEVAARVRLLPCSMSQVSSGGGEGGVQGVELHPSSFTQVAPRGGPRGWCTPTEAWQHKYGTNALLPPGESSSGGACPLQAAMLQEAWEFAPTDRILHCLPLHHILPPHPASLAEHHQPPNVESLNQ